MSLSCPYDKLSLMTALFTADAKLVAYEKEHGEGSIESAMTFLPSVKTGADENRAAAEYHGITVEGLINSPNYKILKEEFAASFISKGLARLKENFGLDDKEAWAIVMAGTGKL